MVLLKHLMVDTRTHVITIDPANRHELDEVLITFLVLCKQNQVPTTHICLALLERQSTVSHIDLTAKDRHNGRFTCL